MKIDDQLLEHIEKLAKLKVNEQDKALTLKKIAFVLDNMDKIPPETIENLQPLSHPLEIVQVMRPDTNDSHIDREVLQRNAPQLSDGLFIVPKVIE